MWPYRPVVYVNWHESVRYCEWATQHYECRRLRLPTSEEWESVAAGENRHEYPWGNEDPDDARSNFDMRVGRVTPVGLFPAGNTVSGVADLAGNVWEWTASEDPEHQGAMILRGGAFNGDAWPCGPRSVSGTRLSTGTATSGFVASGNKFPWLFSLFPFSFWRNRPS